MADRQISQIGAGRRKWMEAAIRPIACHNTSIQVLEIGSWKGESACFWAKMLKRYECKGSVLCVDAWEALYIPSKETTSGTRQRLTMMNKEASDGTALAAFLKNTRKHPNIRPIKGPSNFVLRRLQPIFSFIYVDGSHYYDDVLQDLKEAIRLIKPGGRICGDDLEYQYHELDKAEHEVTYRLKDTDYIKRGKKRWHPGVTLAVRDVFGKVEAHYGIWWYDHTI